MADEDNNIVAMDHDEFDRDILTDRLNGLSVYELSLKYKKAARTITRSLARTLPELTPELRMRLYLEDLARIDVLLGVYYQQAKGGNIAAAGICIKLFERRAMMTGGQAAQKIQIVESGASEEGSSTAVLLRELNRIASEPKQPGLQLELVSSDPDLEPGPPAF